MHDALFFNVSNSSSGLEGREKKNPAHGRPLNNWTNADSSINTKKYMDKKNKNKFDTSLLARVTGETHYGPGSPASDTTSVWLLKSQPLLRAELKGNLFAVIIFPACTFMPSLVISEFISLLSAGICCNRDVLSLGTFSKSGLDPPPPVLYTLGVTFV